MKTFKIPTLDKWMVIVNTPELIEEIQKAPDHVLSFEAAVDDVRIFTILDVLCCRLLAKLIGCNSHLLL